VFARGKRKMRKTKNFFLRVPIDRIGRFLVTIFSAPIDMSAFVEPIPRRAAIRAAA
jgi:hypothetical protein